MVTVYNPDAHDVETESEARDVLRDSAPERLRCDGCESAAKGVEGTPQAQPHALAGYAAETFARVSHGRNQQSVQPRNKTRFNARSQIAWSRWSRCSWKLLQCAHDGGGGGKHCGIVLPSVFFFTTHPP